MTRPARSALPGAPAAHAVGAANTARTVHTVHTVHAANTARTAFAAHHARATVAAVLAVLAATLAAPVFAAPPSFAEVRAAWRPSDAQLLDRHGELLQTLRLDGTQRRLQWVTLERVSPAFHDALLRSEDRRFYEHGGIDWPAVGAALAGTARSAAGAASGDGGPRSVRGASTITMQLAGLLEDAPRTGRRSLAQKADQAIDALALERRWTKAQILEAYVNLVPFRGELVGLGALSELLFGKDPASLDVAESALAAALIRGPNASPERVAARACLLLDADEQARLCASLAGRARLAFARAEPASPLAPGLAPHLARRLLREPGQAFHSTLDARLQRVAIESLRRHVRELAGRNVHDGAVLVLDNATGEVLAWVGSTGPLSDAAQVDAVTAPRQAGSTLKPFLYAQAIGERRLTAASLLEDGPLDLPAGGGLYGPQNYDRGFKGTVSVRTALASSLNVPAVRTGLMVTPVSFAQTLQRLGLRTVDRGGDHYGHSLALGSADVTLLDLTNAYRALANGGRVSAVRFDSTAPTGVVAVRPVIDPAASFIVADILADRNARALTFGWDSPLALRFWTAVKTGTSKDMRDNWCIGFSRRYTVGVWMGNAAGEPMWDVSGVSGAAPVWAELMRALHAAGGEPPLVPPPGLVRMPVRFEQGIEPSRTEWFLAGTELAVVATATAAARAAIVVPIEGTIVSLDPDIPPANQRLRLEARGGGDDMRWFVDGRAIGRGPLVWWFPLPGRHELQLRSGAGAVLDTVRLEVRGARLGAPRSGCTPATTTCGAPRGS